MAGIKILNKEKNETIKLQSSLGIINEIYSGKNKWFMSRMDGTSAMKWRPPKHDLEEGL